jgi:hypothetical protein
MTDKKGKLGGCVDCLPTQYSCDNKKFRALMTEAVSTSEMSVNFYETTWCNIPEDSNPNIISIQTPCTHIINGVINYYY